MTLVIDSPIISPAIFKLKLRPKINLTEDQLYEFCLLNRDLRIEQTAEGELLIMPPAGSETGRRNNSLSGQLWYWTKKDGTGADFDSSAGFRLPSGSVRSPDASWIERSRWESVPPEKREKFAPVCPDFVVELLSPEDNPDLTRAKMEEYIENGARLGWLIDPKQKQVCVYRPGVPVQCLDNPASISADPELPGFILDLTEIWK